MIFDLQYRLVSCFHSSATKKIRKIKSGKYHFFEPFLNVFWPNRNLPIYHLSCSLRTNLLFKSFIKKLQPILDGALHKISKYFKIRNCKIISVSPLFGENCKFNISSHRVKLNDKKLSKNQYKIQIIIRVKYKNGLVTRINYRDLANERNFKTCYCYIYKI